MIRNSTQSARDEQKDLRRKYREAAKNLNSDGFPRKEYSPMEIQIPQHGNVQLAEDGAFVEAIIWVPKEML